VDDYLAWLSWGLVMGGILAVAKRPQTGHE
jgi:hypothetical protein